MVRDLSPQKRRLLYFALFSVYVIWGSTYLGIRIAIEAIPPWAVCAGRNLLGGAMMAILSLAVKEARLPRQEAKVAVGSGTLLILANGLVGLSEVWVPSGLAAVVIGAMPIWIMVFGWMFFGTGKPSGLRLLGAFIGLTGIATIALQGSSHDATAHASQMGLLVLLGSSWIWAAGTLLQRKAPLVKSAFAFSSLQLLSGGVVVGLISAFSERPWTLPAEAITTRSLLAILYLAVFGSVIAFTAYSWLSRNAEPHLVSTYALVNPLIAVGLGWIVFSEPVTLRFAMATALVVGGLALMILGAPRRLTPIPNASAEQTR